MSYVQQISSALEKEAENIAFLAHFPAAKLENKLTSVRNQISIAEKSGQTGALELLKLWESQILEAQVLKQEYNLEDNPNLDMKMQLLEVEAYEMIEKRQQILRKKLLKEGLSEKETTRHRTV